jgi:hypothetical protein
MRKTTGSQEVKAETEDLDHESIGFFSLKSYDPMDATSKQRYSGHSVLKYNHIYNPSLIHSMGTTFN